MAISNGICCTYDLLIKSVCADKAAMDLTSNLYDKLKIQNLWLKMMFFLIKVENRKLKLKRLDYY